MKTWPAKMLLGCGQHLDDASTEDMCFLFVIVAVFVLVFFSARTDCSVCLPFIWMYIVPSFNSSCVAETYLFRVIRLFRVFISSALKCGCTIAESGISLTCTNTGMEAIHPPHPPLIDHSFTHSRSPTPQVLGKPRPACRASVFPRWISNCGQRRRFLG